MFKSDYFSKNWSPPSMSRSSHQRSSLRKSVRRNFTKFTGQYCAKISFLIKLQVSVCNFNKNETLAQVFSSEFCETFKKTSFIEHLWATASACQALLEFRIPSPAWCFSVISENMYPTTNSTLLQNNLKYKHDFSKHLMFMYTF